MKKLICIVLLNVIFISIWLIGKSQSVKEEQFNVNITISSDAAPEMIDEVEKAIKILPKEVIRSFVENDWKIVLLRELEEVENYERFGGDSSIVGLINYTYKTITICGVPDYENAVRDIAIHEFCHYTDRYFKESDSKEIAELYEKYKEGRYITYSYSGIPEDDRYQTDILYATSTVHEFFAETMKDYLLHEEYLKENYPDIHTYHRLFLQKVK